MQKNNTTAPIYFHFMLPVSFSQRTLVKEVIRDLFKKEKTKLEQLQYIFCSDDYLLEINKQHLQHNYYTDIITFDLSEKSNAVIGEIYISVDRVKENARNYSASFKQELLRVIFHGALHLCGHKDKTEKDQVLMRKAEDKYLQYFLSKVK
ncbi:rRNA maturation RNase YbeY [Niastella populi]|uniref:Endoribonuclease YbeY n=1 Tax=Niastella populi TaxID=550983 RepID=A0A1V9FTL5_9BACT|nr:rRNA maturation RNase YbeY [Niastella populi]OQP61671.1 rRNA maturation RNase YbeY [Niastella populi]